MTNIHHLADAVASIPGLEVFSSCGGHPKPKRGQTPAGSFYVTLAADQNSDGWRALTVLSRALLDYEHRDHVHLDAWFAGDHETPADEPRCLAFELRGSMPANADGLTEAIYATMASVIEEMRMHQRLCNER